MFTPRMERSLDSFQHMVARRITIRQKRRLGGGSWAYPPFEEAMGLVGFEGISKFISRRQNMVAQYIATRKLLDLFERSAQRPVARVSCGGGNRPNRLRLG